MVNQYSAHSFARNWLSWISGKERENDPTKECYPSSFRTRDLLKLTEKEIKSACKINENDSKIAWKCTLRQSSFKNFPWGGGGGNPGPPYKRGNPLSYSPPVAAYAARYMLSAVNAQPPAPPPPPPATSSRGNSIVLGIGCTFFFLTRIFTSDASNDIHTPGPSCSKRRQLNELVNGHFVNCFSGFNIQYSDIFFAEKKSALQKLPTIFQQKKSAYLRITRCKFLTNR